MIDINKLILKFTWKSKEARVVKFEKKKFRELILPDIEIYYKDNNNQESMILTKGWIHRSREQNKSPAVEANNSDQDSLLLA